MCTTSLSFLQNLREEPLKRYYIFRTLYLQFQSIQCDSLNAKLNNCCEILKNLGSTNTYDSLMIPDDLKITLPWIPEQCSKMVCT